MTTLLYGSQSSYEQQGCASDGKAIELAEVEGNGYDMLCEYTMTTLRGEELQPRRSLPRVVVRCAGYEPEADTT